MFHTNIWSIFFRYNNEIAIKRERMRQKQKLPPPPPPPPAKKITPVDPDQPSTSSQAFMSVPSDDESSSSEQHSEEEAITASMPPKEIPPSRLNPLIDRIPAMQDFLTYLVSMDGGCRPKQASIENVRRSCCRKFKQAHRTWNFCGTTWQSTSCGSGFFKTTTWPENPGRSTP